MCVCGVFLDLWFGDGAGVGGLVFWAVGGECSCVPDFGALDLVYVELAVGGSWGQVVGHMGSGQATPAGCSRLPRPVTELPWCADAAGTLVAAAELQVVGHLGRQCPPGVVMGGGASHTVAITQSQVLCSIILSPASCMSDTIMMHVSTCMLIACSQPVA